MTKEDIRPTAAAATLTIAPSLLTAFSPGRADIAAAARWYDASDELWETDAIHRAKNLAHMAESISRIGPRKFGLQADANFARDAERLAAAYEELGAEPNRATLAPCEKPLEHISTALVALLTDGSKVEISVRSDEISLSSDRRRAIILIASELC